jgi:putative drug exporter of the RND superfamily
MARHRRAVLAAWIVALGISVALYPSLHKVLSAPDYSVDGSQSAAVERLLAQPGFRGAGSEQDAIVFYASEHRAGERVYRAAVARVLRAVRSHVYVLALVGPYARGARSQISADGHAALARLALGGNARQRFTRVGALQAVVAHAAGTGVGAWLTGNSPLSRDISLTETADSERSEAIGVPLAFVVLLLALGAVGAAVVPLLLAGSGVLVTSGVIALLGRLIQFDVFMLTVVTMIGVGIGIDYSLFVVSRFREELAALPPSARQERRLIARAVAGAVATSGRTILYSGVIVALSLTSLLVVRAPIFREFVIGTGAVVTCTLLAALTLLPALLAQLGRRVNAGMLSPRLQPVDARGQAGEGDGGWAGWARTMMRRPALVSILVLAMLGGAMAPILHLRSGINLDIPALSKTPSGRASAILARSFSAGLTAPLEVVLTHRGQPEAASGRARTAPTAVPEGAVSPASVHGAAARLDAQLRADRRVASVVVEPFRTGTLLTVVPAVAIDSPATQALVRHIRAAAAPGIERAYGVQILVGGWPAQAVDASTITSGRLPLVLGITLGMSLLFLLVVFRSIVLPIKAVAMNLLATGATLGLVVLVFQDGHGERLLGFSSPGFIQVYLPLSMFVLLFGLSMDYEIFLIRRMQETWRRTADNGRAVSSGIAHTARPISAAAAIMVVVFGSNVTAQVLELKQFGFALAAAIAIDATLVRLVLVPALMCLMGARNWWLPNRLAAALPRLELD